MGPPADGIHLTGQFGMDLLQGIFGAVAGVGFLFLIFKGFLKLPAQTFQNLSQFMQFPDSQGGKRCLQVSVAQNAAGMHQGLNGMGDGPVDHQKNDGGQNQRQNQDNPAHDRTAGGLVLPERNPPKDQDQQGGTGKAGQQTDGQRTCPGFWNRSF